MKSPEFIIALIILTIFGFQIKAQSSEDAYTVLKKSADMVYKSSTLYWERDFSESTVSGKTFQCKEQYYLQNNSNGTFNALYDLTVFTGIAKMPDFHTIFLKNAEGLWEVYPTLAIDVSSISKDPQSIDPFQHFRTLTRERYKLELSETNESNQALYIITGQSLQPDADSKISVTNGFVPITLKYIINKSTFLPQEVDEVEQNNQKINKKLNSIELNRKFDASLFELGNRKRSTPLTLREYAGLKLEGLQHEFNIKEDLKLPPEIKNVAAKKTFIRLTIFVILPIVTIALLIYAIRTKQSV
jgi:hypothetical protein